MRSERWAPYPACPRAMKSPPMWYGKCPTDMHVYAIAMQSPVLIARFLRACYENSGTGRCKPMCML
eukprot:1085256-Rhodomonas_salina.2